MIGRLLLAPVEAPERSERFGLIDVVRGAAAVCILFYHYIHFRYAPGQVEAPELAGADLPLYAVLWPLYAHGQAAVPAFWIISGFVFAGVYGGGGGSTRGFVVNRVARLYPLHLLSLCLVALLQAAYGGVYGSFFVYPFNDPPHFLLQLGLASSWGLERGDSFNGPIWSVSAEVIVYAVFWAVLPVLFRRGVLVPLAMAAVFAALSRVNGPIGGCGLYFFLGAAVFVTHRALRAARRAGAALALPAIAAGGLVLLLPGPPEVAYLPALAGGTVLLAASVETPRLSRLIERRLAWLGDLTYGSYLLHFPVQLGLVLAFAGLGRSLPAEEPWFLLLFLLLTLGLSRVCFVLVERPARELIRSVGSPRRA